MTEAPIRKEVSLANRILANEGSSTPSGTSTAPSDDPGQFLLSRHRAPALVAPEVLLQSTLDSKAVHADRPFRHYGERTIHGCDLPGASRRHGDLPSPRARMLPYAIARAAHGAGLSPRRQHGRDGAVLGQPRRLRRHRAGPRQARERRSLAKALGPSSTILMGRHGATVAGHRCASASSADLLRPQRRAADAGKTPRRRASAERRRNCEGRPPLRSAPAPGRQRECWKTARRKRCPPLSAW